MANSPGEQLLPEASGGSAKPQLTREIVAGLTLALPTGATLQAALRAVADECESRAAAAALTRLADRAERGAPFESLFQNEDYGLPGALVAVLRGSAGDDSQGDVRVAALERWISDRDLHDDLRGEIRSALAYPATVTYLAALMLPFTAMVLAPSFQQLIAEFEMKPTMLTRGLEALAVGGPWMLVALLLLPGLLLAMRFLGGKTFWRLWCGQLPLIGPLWRWLTLAAWARWLALLIEARIPLADSLRLAGAAVGDNRLDAAARRLATRVSLGGGIGLAMADADEWPATATVIVGWGERSQSLPDCLRAVAETCEARARLRTGWVRMVAPPLAFIGVGMMVAGTYWMMLAPMMNLISMFS
ncbi:MAG: Type secretion system protein [Planctomycetota bacterium]|jgi:type II secretory pathway component PulF